MFNDDLHIMTETQSETTPSTTHLNNQLLKIPYLENLCIIIFITPLKMEERHLRYTILNILKTKSNFTLLLYIPFLGIGEWYFKCF